MLTQDMRENADALRLVKEVHLERYLESLLRLSSLLCSRQLHFGQLVTKDIFDGDALYCLTHDKQAPASYEAKMVMTLVSQGSTIFVPFLC